MRWLALPVSFLPHGLSILLNAIKSSTSGIDDMEMALGASHPLAAAFKHDKTSCMQVKAVCKVPSIMGIKGT
jgi:hypothetical protein